MFNWKEQDYLSFIPDVEKMPPGRFKLVFRFLRTQKRLEELEESIERIEGSLKKLMLEWDDTYDKFRHLHFRVSKRVKALEAAEPDATEVSGEDGGPMRSPSQLSERQIAMNQKILSRRLFRQNKTQ